jgi:hypothetical protein
MVTPAEVRSGLSQECRREVTVVGRLNILDSAAQNASIVATDATIQYRPALMNVESSGSCSSESFIHPCSPRSRSTVRSHASLAIAE